MRRWPKLIAALAVLNLPATAPAVPASANPAVGANTELASLYESICEARGAPSGEFQEVTSNDIPADLRGMYIGPQEGRYWRRQGERPAFVVLTRGPGHWGGVEEYCIVGVQDAVFETVVRTYSRRMHDRSMYRRDGSVQSWEHSGLLNVNLTDRRNRTLMMITQRPDGWVSLFTGGQVDAATSRGGSERREMNVDPR